MSPTRETFGNIPHGSVVIFYCLTVLTLAVFGNGVWRRVKLWRQGVSISVCALLAGNLRQIWNKLRPGVRRLLAEGLGQARVRGRGLASWAHIWLFAGFMVLLLGTTMLEIDHLASGLSPALHFHPGVYYIIYEFTLDVVGLLFLAGCLLFSWRRLRRPASVGHRATDWYVIIFFLAIGITGYLVEGLRIVWQHPTGIAAACSPVGLLISQQFSGMTEASARSAHLALWWIHAALVFGFLASIPDLDRRRLLSRRAADLSAVLGHDGSQCPFCASGALVDTRCARIWLHRVHSLHAPHAHHRWVAQSLLRPAGTWLDGSGYPGGSGENGTDWCERD